MKDLKKFYDERYSGDYMEDFVKGYDYEYTRRAKFLYIFKKLKLNPKRILDYGCGQGKYISVLKELFPNSTIAGADISKIALDKAKRRFLECQFYEVINDKTITSGPFDLILSVEVFEHVEKIEDTVKDVCRLLNKGGILVFSTPCANKFSLEYFMSKIKKDGIQPSIDGYRRFYLDDPGHIRRLKSKELSNLLKKEGLKELVVYFHLHFFGSLQWMLGDKLRVTPTIFKQRTIKGKIKSILVLPLQPLVYLFDLLSYLEWVICKRSPNGSTMFGVFQK